MTRTSDRALARGAVRYFATKRGIRSAAELHRRAIKSGQRISLSSCENAYHRDRAGQLVAIRIAGALGVKVARLYTAVPRR